MLTNANHSFNFKQSYTFNNSNLTKVDNRINALISDYSKLLVIRLDFGIKKEHSHLVNYHYMNNAFEQLRNNLRHNKLFEHYISYIAKLKYGMDKSWHYHVLFFYDGNQVNHDIWLSQQLGEYWVNVITKGIGVYYSANQHQSDYLYNGMGMLHYWDTNKISILKQAASYLTKLDENIINNGWVDASGKMIRSFRMGQYKPKQIYGDGSNSGNRIGRPRLYSVTL